jgi:hypothetical protein
VVWESPHEARKLATLYGPTVAGKTRPVVSRADGHDHVTVGSLSGDDDRPSADRACINHLVAVLTVGAQPGEKLPAIYEGV